MPTFDRAAVRLPSRGPKSDRYMGERERHRNKQTGTVIVVLNARTPPTWLPDRGGKWVTLCEQHAYVMNHRTLSDARGWAAAPASWCDDCSRLLERWDGAGPDDI